MRKINVFSMLFAALCMVATPVIAATLTVQSMSLDGLQYTSAAVAAASGGDSFSNDGRTFYLITNASAGTRTATFDAVASLTKPGFGTVTITDTAVTVPGSGTNGGRVMIGPFPPDRFNNSVGHVSVTYSDSGANLTVVPVKMPGY